MPAEPQLERVWVKLCGIRTVADAQAAVEAGADAIGLNFYAKSVRCVEVETARDIVAALPEHVEAVGVFVNHSLEEIETIARGCRLSMIQLHGDEPPEMMQSLADWRVIRAVRLSAATGLTPVTENLAATSFIRRPDFYLVDAHIAGAYGGTGQRAPWDLLRGDWQRGPWPPLILAGGLTPENVSEAVRTVRPWGVDVAGGVESGPGVKDPDRMRAFVQAARSIPQPG